MVDIEFNGLRVEVINRLEVIRVQSFGLACMYLLKFNDPCVAEQVRITQAESFQDGDLTIFLKA
jgi:hypothetical protein